MASTNLGPVTGTITGTYTAKFIGAQARERNRQQKIEECKEILSDLGKQRASCQEKAKTYKASAKAFAGVSDISER